MKHIMNDKTFNAFTTSKLISKICETLASNKEKD